MKTRTRAALVARCATLGVELVAAGHDADLEALCPQGQRFVSSKTHMIRIATFNNWSWPMPEAYGQLFEDLALGLEPCDDKGCDYCTEEEAR
jgi:hypothetical protein